MNRIQECKIIYNQAFKDEDCEFSDRLFSICSGTLRTLDYNNEIASMVFLLPCKIHCNSLVLNAYYIYAAATLEKYRNIGLMKKLLTTITDQKDSLYILKPANKALEEYYCKLGFKSFNATKNPDKIKYIEPINEFKKLCIKERIENSTEQFIGMYYNLNKINLENLYFPYIME